MRHVIIVIALVALSYACRAQSCDSLRRQDSIVIERYLDRLTDLTVQLRREQSAFGNYKDHTEEFVLEFGKIRNQRTIYLSTSAAGVAGVILLLLLRH